MLKLMLKEKRNNENLIDDQYLISTCNRDYYNIYFIHDLKNKNRRLFYNHNNRKKFISDCYEIINNLRVY